MPHSSQPVLTARAAPRRLPGCAEGAAMAGGPQREALARALQQLTLAEAMAGPCQPAGLCQALAEVARTLSALQAYGPAESYLAQALHWAVVMGSTDNRGDLHCTLAELATDAAELADARDEAPAAVYHWQDRARDHACEAAGLARQTSDPHWELKLLLRASDVLDRCGDHDDAVQLQQRALVLMGLQHPALPADADTPGAAAQAAWRSTAPRQLM